MKRGGARKYIMRGGAYYVMMNDPVQPGTDRYVVKEIPTRGPWLRPGTKDPDDIRKRLNATPEMDGSIKLADVTMIDSGREYAGKLGAKRIRIYRYSNATAAAAGTANVVAAAKARAARKEEEDGARDKMIEQRDQTKGLGVYRSNYQAEAGVDDGDWANQQHIHAGTSDSSKPAAGVASYLSDLPAPDSSDDEE